MSHIIVKHEIEHKINLSLFRNRGDVFQTARELNVPVDYVKKIYQKLRKRRERDVSYWIASSIMQTVFEGYQQRTGYIQRYLSMLDGKEELPVSSCHHKPLTLRLNKQKEEVVVCTKCLQECDTIILPRSETYALFSNLVEQLREEDTSLVKFADTMGFTDKEEQPAIRQNILVVGDKTVDVDSKIADEFNKLTPREREKTRKRLERHLLEAQETLEPELEE